MSTISLRRASYQQAGVKGYTAPIAPPAVMPKPVITKNDKALLLQVEQHIAKMRKTAIKKNYNAQLHALKSAINQIEPFAL